MRLIHMQAGCWSRVHVREETAIRFRVFNRTLGVQYAGGNAPLGREDRKRIVELREVWRSPPSRRHACVATGGDRCES